MTDTRGPLLCVSCLHSEEQHKNPKWLLGDNCEIEGCTCVGYTEPEDKGVRVIQLETAVERALEELGEPQPGYPAPVTNAVDILKAALRNSRTT